MKKFFMIILFASTVIFASEESNAQTTVGGGIAYGTDIESLGIHANGQFFINDRLAITPSILYYFPKEIVEGFNYKWFEINGNASYYFITDENINVYGLAGLNVAIISFPFINVTNIFGGGDTSSSTTKVGLNIGVGADFDIGSNITPFGQLRYNISSFDQLAIEAGVRFPLN